MKLRSPLVALTTVTCLTAGAPEVPPFVREIAANHAASFFQSSLTMRELSDIIVIPVILVQEALTDEVLPGYPGD